MSIKKLQRPVDSVFANFSKGSAKFMDLELSDSEIQELQQKGLSVEVLDKFDKGGNVFPYKSPLKPYVPKSVEDHLYRKGMYADSLSLYNAHVFQKNSWKPGSEEFLTKHGGSKEDIKKLRAQRSSMIATHGRNFIGFNYATYNSKNLASPGQSYPVMPSEQVIVDKYKELIKHNPSSFKIGYYSSPDLWHKSIKPIGTYIDGDFSPIYKKPVQEIADVNTGDSLPVKSVLNFPRSYPELAVSNFDGVKKSLPTPYSMSGRQQTVLTWNPELKRHDETVRVQDDAFIKDKEEWEDNSQPVVYYNPETKEYRDKPFVFNYEGRNQTYKFNKGGPLRLYYKYQIGGMFMGGAFLNKKKLLKDITTETPALGSYDQYEILRAKGKDLKHLQNTGRGLEYFPKGDTKYPFMDDGEMMPLKHADKQRTMVNMKGKSKEQVREAVKLDMISHGMQGNTDYSNFKGDLESKLYTQYGEEMVNRNGGVDAYVRGYLAKTADYQPYRDEMSFLPSNYFNTLNTILNTPQNKNGGTLDFKASLLYKKKL